MRAEPAWERLPTDLSPALDTYLKRCLQKDPRQRVRDIGDVRLALEGAFDMTGVAVERPAERQLRVWQRPVPATLALLVALTVGGLAVWSFTGSGDPPADVMQFVITPPGNAPLTLDQGWRDIAISPDGTQIVYKDNFGINLRRVEEATAAPLRGGERGVGMFFSPDGEWVGFHHRTPTTLQKVSIFGGPPITIAESQNRIMGASWGRDNRIIFGTGDGLFSVSADGGEPERLTTPDRERGELDHGWPFIIPERQAVLCVVSAGQRLATGQLAVLDLGTRHTTMLGLAGVSPHYVSTGHIVYAAGDGSVRGVPFDAERLEVTGSQVPLIEGVRIKDTCAANFSISNNGRLIHALGGLGGGASLRTLVWVDRSGRDEPAVAEPRGFLEFSLSPDGDRAAARVLGTGRSDVWVFDLIRNTSTRLTFGDRLFQFPTWTPDGTRIAFGAPVAWKAADGTGEIEQLSEAEATFPQDFALDESAVVVETRGADGIRDLGVVALDGDGTVTPLLNESFAEQNADISPDGRWVAYQSDETGRFEIYVRPFPNVDEGRWEVSSNGGVWPIWNPSGQELFFLTLDDLHLTALSYQADPTFTPGSVTTLFEMREKGYVGNCVGSRRIAVAPDGERFLLHKTADEPGSAEISVTLNWFQELTERVPVP